MITVEHVTKTIQGKTILDDITCTIEKGSFTIIVGPNGAGKSTLMKIILHIIPATSGTVFIDGLDTAHASRRMIATKASYCPQMKEAMPPMRVEDFLLLSRFPYAGHFAAFNDEDRRHCRDAADAVGITHLTDRTVSTLSGGEMQSVMIASALVQDTPVMCLDEPTVFLDMNHREEVFRLLADIHARHGKTIVLVTHYFDYAVNFADRIIALKQGKLFFDGTPEEAVRTDLATGLFDIPVEYIAHNGKTVTVIR